MSNADWVAASEDILDGLAGDDTATYCQQGASAVVTLVGTFDRQTQFVELDDGSAQTFVARFSAKTSQLPATVAEGDTLVDNISGVTYTLATVEPDNLGLTDFLLKK